MEIKIEAVIAEIRKSGRPGPETRDVVETVTRLVLERLRDHFASAERFRSEGTLRERVTRDERRVT